MSAHSHTAEPLDTSNSIFQKAVAFVRDTNENLFLTGKAGTGKTTFLKYIRTQTAKACAVVAPTGVAAINAGGETIHSFLQLPMGPFVPGSAGGFGRQGETNDKHSLLSGMKMRDTKLRLLRKLQLLIIDEVSMVRCDLLDSMDLVLRHVRKNWAQPFGGVQVIFIGDLFQLPPVAPEADWSILSQFYASPYFFDSVVLRQYPPLYIELKKIYRQKDQAFVDILNRVRNGNVLREDVDMLNLQHDPEPQKEKGYIILSTHNRIADEINQVALEQLAGKLHRFEGVVKDDFNLKNLPTDKVLQLKTGAQIMFIRNDLKTPRRYYNGKIGLVDAIDNAGVWIAFLDEKNAERIVLENETWKNVRYTLKNGSIEEEETGSFTQFPIRLAWAITVHKSQGLTLQKAVVDLGQSFAPGQVYVALSRCTTMQGLVLRSRLYMENVIVDARVVAFAQSGHDEDELEDLLASGRRQAAAQLLAETFSFTELIAHAEPIRPFIMKRKAGPKEENLELIDKLLATLRQAQGHAVSFGKQLLQLSIDGDDAKLQQRKAAAIRYFTTDVLGAAMQNITDHEIFLAKYTKAMRHTKIWQDLHAAISQKADELRNV